MKEFCKISALLLLSVCIVSCKQNKVIKKYDFVIDDWMKMYSSVITTGDTIFLRYMHTDSLFNITGIIPDTFNIHYNDTGLILEYLPFNLKGNNCYSFEIKDNSSDGAVNVCRIKGPFDYQEGDINIKDAYVFEFYFSELGIVDTYDIRYYYDSNRKLVVRFEQLYGPEKKIIMTYRLVNETVL